jgi:hypothetical protein
MNNISRCFVLMFGRGCLRNCKHGEELKENRHMFHPIDKDERLLSVASDIEIVNVQVERDYLGKIGEFLEI